MDGGRRLLRSVNGLETALAASRPVFAVALAQRGYAGAPAERKLFRLKSAVRSRPRHRQGDNWKRSLIEFLRLPGLGLGLGLLFFGAVGFSGAKLGGEYDAFVRENGQPRDLIARALGFGLDSVTIAGQVELNQKQILDMAGVNARQSLLFLDADDIRRKLMAVPLVKNVSVRKLFPGRLMIEVVERQPFGLWQQDGVVHIVATDGAPIDVFQDDKFAGLPFVVGEGANLRIDEFMSLLVAAGDLRPKIRAGMLVSNRRWTLKMNNNVEVLLPEADPKAAVALLAKLEAERGVLEKDVVSLDLRVAGKLYVRLTEEAAAAREAAKAAHGAKGAHT
jgi:cell division protein FtsQ